MYFGALGYSSLSCYKNRASTPRLHITLPAYAGYYRLSALLSQVYSHSIAPAGAAVAHIATGAAIAHIAKASRVRFFFIFPQIYWGAFRRQHAEGP